MITKEDIVPVYFSEVEIGYISWVGFCRYKNKRTPSGGYKEGQDPYIWHQRGFAGEFACKKLLSCTIDTNFYNAGGDENKPDGYLLGGESVAIKTKFVNSNLIIDKRDIVNKQYVIFCWYHESLKEVDIVGYITTHALYKKGKLITIEGKPGALLLSWERLWPIKDLILLI